MIKQSTPTYQTNGRWELVLVRPIYRSDVAGFPIEKMRFLLYDFIVMKCNAEAGECCERY